MTNREKTRLSLGGIALAIVTAAAVVMIGNNVGTQSERCNRFWQSRAAASECRQRLANDEMDRADARSGELQRQVDLGQRRIDQTEQNIRNADRALADLRAAKE